MSDLFRHLQSTLADRYELERELGEGGMATVYLARDLRHPRKVAVKVLRPELVVGMGQERFHREILISSELSHPHILALLDSGTVPSGNGYPELPFYSMPYVDGESLRTRLVRERQMDIDDALEIARDVAAALGHAHAHGRVHRDIKPENILLVGNNAVVADFGIARAIQESVDPRTLTSENLAVGTPHYMSPEQAGSERSLDGRSDIYSLGCVLYEMLGGEPPFTGPNPRAVMARHLLDPVPPLHTIRATVPPSVEQAVMRALQKAPADRFATAEQFAEALHVRHSGESSGAPARARRRWAPLVSLALLAVAAATWYLTGERAVGSRGGVGADTTRYAILSFGQDAGVPDGLHPALLLSDAMGRWDGITSVEPFQVREILSRRDTAGFDDADWRRTALKLGAGRYVLGAASRVGDTIRVHAVLYDAAPRGAGPALREHTVRLPLDLNGADRAFAELADSLLLRNAGAGGRQPAGVTVSLPARQAFDEGSSAINSWDLADADAHFAAATRHDPQYAQAYLWLALIRSWSPEEPVATWQSAAERAAAARNDLSARDRQISDAVLALARGDAGAACRIWQALTEQYPHDFVVWYGLADCLDRDRLVISDPTSPTGWRFRSSLHQALNAYQQSYALLPSILRGFREESFSGMVHLLMASGSDLRSGRGRAPDPTFFIAALQWAGDTLVLYPVPADAAVRSVYPTTAEAVRHQRQRLYEIAAGWAAAYPTSADALQALALSLQLLGDRSALDTLVHARSLARGPAEVIRVTTSEIWMRVLTNAPSGLAELRTARRLADSLLASIPPESPMEPSLLASVAALTGRAHEAARLGRRVPLRTRPATPPPLAGLGITFLTYAAMGGPVDSLPGLERRVTEALARDVVGSDLPQAREQWLTLPAILAFPVYPLPSVEFLGAAGTGLLAADAAFMRGDSAGAWRELEPTVPKRDSTAPEDLTIDVAYPSAWLAEALGRRAAALAFLDASLNTLGRSPPQLFLDVNRAGVLARAMAFRAELAERSGDRATAREWAAAVIVLWSGGDVFLQPLVKRMEGLAH